MPRLKMRWPPNWRAPAAAFGLSAAWHDVPQRPGLRVVSLLTVAWVVGCGQAVEPFACVPVGGTVVYEDGTSIPGAYLQFVPQTPPLDKKTFPRPGVAELAPDGKILSVTTYNFGDGVIAGEHKVIVKSQTASGARTKAVGPEYGDERTTPLTVRTDESPFLLKVAKPQSRR
jgi:hypothetical protein